MFESRYLRQNVIPEEIRSGLTWYALGAAQLVCIAEFALNLHPQRYWYQQPPSGSRMAFGD